MGLNFTFVKFLEHSAFFKNSKSYIDLEAAVPVIIWLQTHQATHLRPQLFFALTVATTFKKQLPLRLLDTAERISAILQSKEGPTTKCVS